MQPLANALDTSVSELLGLQETSSDKVIAEICASFIASKHNLSGGLFGICTLGVLPLHGYIIGSALYSFVKSKSI